MEYTKLDTDSEDPQISGHEVTVSDVSELVRTRLNWHDVAYNEWGLSETEVDQALTYLRNRDDA